MEECKKKSAVEMNDKEIIFSKSIKAGKRIYYLEDEMFLAITESKKIVSGEGDDSQVSFEKHKIFLYKEDFEKFMNGLNQAIEFINETQGEPAQVSQKVDMVETEMQEDCTEKEEKTTGDLADEIKIDIDF